MSELTAAEEVLLAATKLVNGTKDEFTEWDLTVEAWSLNKERWGLRGYEEKYPDHKRVMNEIMAKGTQKVTGRGWLERTRPNHYTVTSIGFAKAESLSGRKIGANARSMWEYESILPYMTHRVFEKYCVDPKEPKTWLGVSAFLGLTSNDPGEVDKRLKKVKTTISDALAWLTKNNEKLLRRSDSSRSFNKTEILKLAEFVSVIETRFKAQFDAIKDRSK